MGILKRLWSLLLGDRRPAAAEGPPRILAYCASNIGMGHYVRLLRVLEEVRRQRPEASILLATDARDLTLAQRIGVAVLQLPRFRFIDQENFGERPELLSITSHELRALRAGLLESLGRDFRPHVLIMDTNPHGKRDEALPLLRLLRRRGGCRTLLLMRDIPAPPGERFKLAGDPAEIRRHAAYYDRLLLAGDANFFDAAEAYGWPPALRAKMAYAGFVVPPAEARPRAEVFSHFPGLDAARPAFLVSFGGGWQAEPFSEHFIEGLRLHRERRGPEAQMVLALGPAVGLECLRQIRRRGEALGGVVVEHFSPHFSQLLLCADFAVLQAGSAAFQALETDIRCC